MSMKFVQLSQYAILVLFSVFILSEQASALPGFSRQTGMSCASCHYASYPALNKAGREFAASGYKIHSDDKKEYFTTSFTPSFVGKVGYLRRQGESYDSFDWPTKASLFLGGELADDVSYLLELGVFGAASDTGGQVDGLLSSKFQFHAGQWGDTRFSIIPFSTIDQGPSYAMELMNTGVRSTNNTIAAKTGYSASQQLGIANSRATGLALTAVGESYFVTYANWQSGWWVDDHTQLISQCAHYVRVGGFSRFSAWELGYGAQTLFHRVSNHTCSGHVSEDTWGTILDLQLQSRERSMPLGIYASLGTIPANTYFNPAAKDEIALGIGVKGAISKQLSLYASMMDYDDGTGSGMQGTETVGLEYRFGEQIKLEFYRDTDANTVIQLYMAM
ncbi:MAG: hypothetical protein OEX12_05550 [Gammaproteobacteria bacterium]|nr:hypothetical protein [Gammaproteobacteria bacterium]